MIGPPTRPVAPSRVTAPSTSAVTAGDGTDTAEVDAALDARIAALIARSKTPEDDALDKQRDEFDLMARVRAESERETNALRDMAMEQMKFDDELLKKWIALI